MPNESTPTLLSSVSRNLLSIVSVLFAIAVIALMAYFMSLPDRTPRETFLEAFVLTVASMFVSVVFTKVYADIAATKNLRNQAVQIAGTVIHLENQTERLRQWVGDKRLQGELGSATDEILFEHVEQSLDGLRDLSFAALKGIGGVIGDDIAQYESLMSQIADKRAESERRQAEFRTKLLRSSSEEEIARLKSQMEENQRKTDAEIIKLARSSALPISQLTQKRVFNTNCPVCRSRNSIDIIDRPGETKRFQCSGCNGYFNFHVLHNSESIVRRAIHKNIAGDGRSAIRVPIVSDALSEPPKLAELRQFLISTRFYLRPATLLALAKLVSEKDQDLRRSTDEEIRTPHRLQSILIELRNSGVLEFSNSEIRIFFKLAYYGRAFRFASESVASLYGEFTNNLDEEELLTAISSAYLFRLRRHFNLNDFQINELSDLFFGDEIDGESILKKAHEGLRPDSEQKLDN